MLVYPSLITLSVFISVQMMLLVYFIILFTFPPHHNISLSPRSYFVTFLMT